MSSHIYRPGLGGWWAHIGLDRMAWMDLLLGRIPRREVLRQAARRARPSARLRQAETERAYWKLTAQEQSR